MKKLGIFLIAVLLVFGISSTVFAYENPLTDFNDTWYEYGNGDPFVMKYNGIYYLYVSTRDDQKGVKCWSSKDMVNWAYEGLCITDQTTLDTSKAAYAPEVTYYNGKFYMYTSPAGRGHYVFESTSPTGPFVRATNNLGMSIDGSVFIDDDGKWYFYRSSDGGILVHEMESPIKINQTTQNVNASMNGWTEGSFLIKKDGKYFLTYTGNHVHSPGYRINYGVGTSPVKFTPSPDNPALINTEAGIVALGHSSTVIGPDLNSYFLFYHNREGVNDKSWPIRNANMDRIVFNGENMDILGPTMTEQDDPQLPLISNYFDTDSLDGWVLNGNGSVQDGALLLSQGKILSDANLQGDYTAEYNISSGDNSGMVGGYFGYVNANNYGSLALDLAAQKLQVTFVVGGVIKTQSATIPKSFGLDHNFTAINTLKVEKISNRFIFYYNNRQVSEYKQDGLNTGKIGYFVENSSGKFGFIGGSNEAGNSSAFDSYKPVPGTIQSVHFNSGGQDVAYHETTNNQNIGWVNNGIYYRDTMVDIGQANGRYHIGWNQPGEWYKYNINVSESGTYDFALSYVSCLDNLFVNGVYNVSYNLYVDDVKVIDNQFLERTDDWINFKTNITREIQLTQGKHVLRLETKNGEFDFSTLTFSKNDMVEDTLLNFNFQEDGATYTDGSWKIENGKLVLNGGDRSVGKRLYGSAGWGDYQVEADIKVLDKGTNAGIIFRATNPAMGDAGTDPVAGGDFYQGYYVGINANSLILGKQNYNWKELDTATRAFAKNITYHLTVVAVKNNIKVYINNEQEPIIDYTDENPFTHGKVGVRGHFSIVEFDNFQVTSFSPYANAMKVERDKEALTLNASEPILGDQIELPLKGLWGSKIYWETSDPQYLSDNGIINRDQLEEKTITLTATIVFEENRDTKSFEIHLNADPNVKEKEFLNILQIGDSNTQSGYLTTNMREILNHKYGNSGTGFVTLNASAYFKKASNDFSFNYEGKWTEYDNASESNHGLLVDSPNGLMLIGQGENSILNIKFIGSAIDLYYLSSPDAGDFRVVIDGEDKGVVSQSQAGDFETHVTSYDQLKYGPHDMKIYVQGNGNVNFYGADVICGNREFRSIVNTWGNDGATTNDYAILTEGIFESALKLINPNKIVVLLGTSDHGLLLEPRPANEVEEDLAAILERIQQALPDTEIWLLSTFDTYDSEHPDSRGMLRQYWHTAFPNAAERTGVNYWPMGEWFGTYNSSKMSDGWNVNDKYGMAIMQELYRKIIAEVKPEIEVDKTLLEAIILLANGIDTSKYTLESSLELNGVVEQAELLYQQEDATQSDIDAIAKKLVEIIKNLEPVTVDQSLLLQLIEIVSDLEEVNYTHETWFELNNALEAAKAIVNSEESDQEDINKVIKVLCNAMVNLQVQVPQEEITTKLKELEALLATVTGDNSKHQSSYTSSSWNTYAAVLNKAQELVASDEITIELLTTVINELQKAIKGLTIAASSGGKTSANIKVTKTPLSPDTGKWYQDSIGWWLAYDNGGYAKAEWKSVNGAWYYFDESGYMAVGWRYLNEKWYYMTSSGAMAVGWILDSGIWYYLNQNGDMSLVDISYQGKTYHFNESGACTNP